LRDAAYGLIRMSGERITIAAKAERVSEPDDRLTEEKPSSI
jgi:hypothetical protein